MQQLRVCTRWGLVMLAIVLSPILVILALPMAIGIGLDIADLGGETPLVLALCAPVVIMLLRRTLPAGALRSVGSLLRARLHLDHAANLIHSP